MTAMSLLALCVLAATCTLGVFHSSFRDNWAQFCGMVGLTLWAVGRIFRIAHGEPVSEWQLLAHVSMASFAVGTALNFLRYARAERKLGRPLTSAERREVVPGRPARWHKG